MTYDKFYIGERLQALIDHKGMTQCALADRLGTKRKEVNDWCNDLKAPSVPTLVRIAELFHVTLDWLITGEDPQSYKLAMHAIRNTIEDMIEDYAHHPGALISAEELLREIDRRMGT